MNDVSASLKGMYQSSMKAGELLTKIQAQAAGWSISSINGKNMCGEQIYLYIHDQESRFTWNASVNYGSFKEIVEHVRKDEAIWPEIRQTLDMRIQEMSED